MAADRIVAAAVAAFRAQRLWYGQTAADASSRVIDACAREPHVVAIRYARSLASSDRDVGASMRVATAAPTMSSRGCSRGYQRENRAVSRRRRQPIGCQSSAGRHGPSLPRPARRHLRVRTPVEVALVMTTGLRRAPRAPRRRAHVKLRGSTCSRSASASRPSCLAATWRGFSRPPRSTGGVRAARTPAPRRRAGSPARQIPDTLKHAGHYLAARKRSGRVALARARRRDGPARRVGRRSADQIGNAAKAAFAAATLVRAAGAPTRRLA